MRTMIVALVGAISWTAVAGLIFFLIRAHEYKKEEPKSYNLDYSPYLVPSRPDIFPNDQSHPTYIVTDCEFHDWGKICLKKQWRV